MIYDTDLTGFNEGHEMTVDIRVQIGMVIM